MRWNFFLGACFLTAALLVPHAGTGPVVAGIVLAFLLRWLGSRFNRRGE
jgi:hypothetical protein